jgi:hypothetical protein
MGILIQLSARCQPLIGAALLIAVVVVQSSASAQTVFSGSWAGWSVQDASPGTFTMRDDVLHVDGAQGWLRSDRQYGDFTLRVEFRFLSIDTDSGIYVRAAPQTPFLRGWPNQSYQVQVRNPLGESRFPPVGGLFRHGMPEGELQFDAASAAKLSKPTGEWQTLEIDAIGDRVTVRLNGAEVMRAGNIANARGYLGIQAEAGAIEYRGLQIRER